MQEYFSEKYDEFYMNLAREAANNSVAKKRKVGCCIVLSNGLVSLGWNGTPSGFDNECEIEGVTKPEVIHAEMNALKKLLLSNVSIYDAIVYITCAPCLNCAVQLVDLGIKTIIVLAGRDDVEGIDLLKSSGVSIEVIEK